MPTPSLLLKPSGSRDAAGTVTPTVTGTSIVLDATLGHNVWSFTPAGSKITVPVGTYLSNTTGTVVVQYRETPGASEYIYIIDGTDYLDCAINQYVLGSGQLVTSIGDYRETWSDDPLVSTWCTFGLAWGGGICTVYYDGDPQPSQTNIPFVLASLANNFMLSADTARYTGLINQVVLYDTKLTDGDIATLAASYDWQWPEPPAPPAPVRIVLGRIDRRF